nr:hypothetical protein GCM10020093_109240 [Planobispora longispora]
MDNSGRPIRFKVTALLLVPIISLVLLWGFAASLTLGDGIRLLEMNTLVGGVATPSEKAVIELQYERLQSARHLKTRSGRELLVQQRLKSDQALAELRRLALAEDTQETVTEDLRMRLTTVFAEFDRLPAARALVDSGSTDAVRVLDAYSQIIDSMFRMYDQMILVPDISIYQQARSVTSLGEAKELLARQRALLSAVGPGGRLSDAEHAAFARMVSTRHLVHRQAMARLDTELRGPYDKLGASAVHREFATLETRVAASRQLPADLSPVDRLWTEVEREQGRLVDLLVERVTPGAATIVIQIAVAGGLGLVMLVLSVLFSLRFAGRLAAELGALRDMATELAEVRLPQLVDRLRRGRPRRRSRCPGSTGPRDPRHRPGARLGPAHRLRGGLGPGPAAPGRQPGPRQPGPAQPVAAPPPAHPAGGDAAQGGAAGDARRPLQPGPPHHQDAPSRGEPDHPVRRGARPGLAQAGPRGGRAARGGGGDRGLLASPGPADPRRLAGRTRGGRPHPPDRRAGGERDGVLPAADTGDRP